MLDNQLDIFITVADKKNFSRAGEYLNMTQPAISQHIHALEDYYGAKLFERSSKKVELTQAGMVLYKYAQEILRLHRVAKKSVADLVDMVTGKLTIGASLTIGEYVLPRLLATFTRKYPDVEYSVLVGNTEIIREFTREGTIDVGLVEGVVEDAQLEIKTFLKDEMLLVAPTLHPLAKKPRVDRDDLKECVFIIREEGSGTRLAMEEFFEKSGFTPDRVITLGSTQAIKEAVESGLGISILSKWSLRKELSLGSLKPLRIKGLEIPRWFFLIKLKDKFQSRASDEFTKLIIGGDLPQILADSLVRQGV
ncbi:MAG: LysR family transcriptional regulator [Actinobacteria bacterium]|nr:LysR family transcriptional regulator [Actinomycetota bacterium]MCL5058925.1 LysR family transcriptional regulator [Actinomycetota bacterium]